jgi:hypothetical protein
MSRNFNWVQNQISKSPQKDSLQILRFLCCGITDGDTAAPALTATAPFAKEGVGLTL